MSNPVPLSLDRPFVFEEPLDMDEARTALKACSRNRKQAREWMQRAALDAAEKERDYRKARARAWPEVAGTAEEKKDAVNDKTSDLRYARDVAVSVMKAALERIEEVDAERASLHKLVEWSMKVAPLGSDTDRAAAHA
jgi:uncharacterized coiled-coil DUF342 family protein